MFCCSPCPAQAVDIVKQIPAMTVTKMRLKRFPLFSVISPLPITCYQAFVVEDDDFAVDDGVLNVQRFGCCGEVAVFRRSVQPAAGEDAHPAGVDDDLGAVAVELDLVSPSVALGQLGDQG